MAAEAVLADIVVMEEVLDLLDLAVVVVEDLMDLPVVLMAAVV